MSQELSNCYEVLGVSEGASAQELKVAYRDLAKVWHPDRFAHDPRLQQKAQEKLKEINEAYEQLTSGKIRFRQRTSREAHTHRPPHTPPNTQQHTPRDAQQQTPQQTPQDSPRAAWRFAVLPVCVFTLVLLVSGSLLIAGRETAPPLAPQETESGNQETESGSVEQPTADGASETLKEQQRAGRRPVSKPLPAEALKEVRVERAAATAPAPLPTVTLTIDPSTGLIATAHCPLKSRMTYADGTEPRQHCSAHKPDTRATANPPQKESRLKSLTGRLASPSKWFRGKEKSGSAARESPASAKTIDQN
jgi:hypothetical protein